MVCESLAYQQCRIVHQQAITQQLVPIYEPLFADGSYAIVRTEVQKMQYCVMEYAEIRLYTFAVLRLVKVLRYLFNHEISHQSSRKNVKDERVVQLIKRYLKSGVMEKQGNR